jgi:hypothetical protein
VTRRWLVVPHATAARATTIWIGVLGQPPPDTVELRVGAASLQPVGSAWSVFEAHSRPVFCSQRVTVAGLEPGRRYPVTLLTGGAPVAEGTAVTLPEALPPIDAKPFICLVGSCFAHFSDGAGAAGAAYRAMPAGVQPDVKFLCGDQVYVDAPFPRFLYTVFAEEDLKAELLATYAATWAQGGDGRGFAELLRAGATYFGSDDHEVWNNAPLPTPVVRATWWPLGDRGAGWSRIASRLYDDFQTPRRSDGFEVAPLSFRIVDTRLARSADRRTFADPVELAAIEEWVRGLNGPGVLVLGQPIFVASAGLKGYLTDFGLADFGQYAELVRALWRSEHDLLVLTGDVHYGRVAGCRLPSGASLIEVIASPFALVDARVGGRWHPPPPVFPAVPVAGTTQAAVWHEPGHQLVGNQFATLEFTADGGRVRTAVRAWPIPAPGQPPTAQLVYQQTLQ